MRFTKMLNDLNSNDVDIYSILGFINTQSDYLSDELKKEILKQLDLDKNNLEQALTKCSGRIYFYGMKENETAVMVEFVSFLLRKREALFLKQFRNDPDNSKIAFKEKEADIKRLLVDDVEWMNLQRCLVTLELIKNEYTSIVKAFETQGRLLLGANKRDLFKDGLN